MKALTAGAFGLLALLTASSAIAEDQPLAAVITQGDDLEDVLMKAKAAKETVEVLTTGEPVKGIVVDMNEKLVMLRDPNKFIGNVFVLKKDVIIGVVKTVGAQK